MYESLRAGKSARRQLLKTPRSEFRFYFILLSATSKSRNLLGRISGIKSISSAVSYLVITTSVEIIDDQSSLSRNGDVDFEGG